MYFFYKSEYRICKTAEVPKITGLKYKGKNEGDERIKDIKHTHKYIWTCHNETFSMDTLNKSGFVSQNWRIGT
jgi:hypothetical protein